MRNVGRKRAKLERERERRLVARHRSHGFGVIKCHGNPLCSSGRIRLTLILVEQGLDIFLLFVAPLQHPFPLHSSSFFFSFFFFFFFHPSRWNTRLNCVGRWVLIKNTIFFFHSTSLSLYFSFSPPLFFRICKFNSTWELWKPRVSPDCFSLWDFNMDYKLLPLSRIVLFSSFFNLFFHLFCSFFLSFSLAIRSVSVDCRINVSLKTLKSDRVRFLRSDYFVIKNSTCPSKVWKCKKHGSRRISWRAIVFSLYRKTAKNGDDSNRPESLIHQPQLPIEMLATLTREI